LVLDAKLPLTLPHSSEASRTELPDRHSPRLRVIGHYAFGGFAEGRELTSRGAAPNRCDH
jgi:hypothetical protein